MTLTGAVGLDEVTEIVTLRRKVYITNQSQVTSEVKNHLQAVVNSLI